MSCDGVLCGAFCLCTFLVRTGEKDSIMKYVSRRKSCLTKLRAKFICCLLRFMEACRSKLVNPVNSVHPQVPRIAVGQWNCREIESRIDKVERKWTKNASVSALLWLVRSSASRWRSSAAARSWLSSCRWASLRRSLQCSHYRPQGNSLIVLWWVQELLQYLDLFAVNCGIEEYATYANVCIMDRRFPTKSIGTSSQPPLMQRMPLPKSMQITSICQVEIWQQKVWLPGATAWSSLASSKMLIHINNLWSQVTSHLFQLFL